MSTVQTKTANPSFLGIPITIPVCATLADYCTSAGITEQDVCDMLNKWWYARTPASKHRAELVKRIEAETGIVREKTTVGEGEDAKTSFVKSEEKYMTEQVVAEGTEYSTDSFKELAQDVADGINWLASPSVGRIGEKWEAAANNMFTLITNAEDSTKALAKMIANMGAKGVSINVDAEGKPSVRDLAGALKAYDIIKARERETELLG